jgi:hypothetical protein
MASLADELDQQAAELEALARSVVTTVDSLLAYHRPDVWQGARADRFGRELAEQRLRVRAAAEALAGSARLTRARADLLRLIQPG